MPEKETLESVAETSRRLAISARTVRRLIKTKQVRAVRVGCRVLIPSSEISRVIASGCGNHAGVQMHAEA
jgi:excisionase family DNA binding protein